MRTCLLKLRSHSLGQKERGLNSRQELAWSSETLHAAAHPKHSGSSYYARSSLVLSAKFGANLLRWFTIPKNRPMSPTLPGVFTFCTAATFSGPGQIPFWSTTCPKNLTCDCENISLDSVSVLPLPVSGEPSSDDDRVPPLYVHVPRCHQSYRPLHLSHSTSHTYVAEHAVVRRWFQMAINENSIDRTGLWR